MRTSPPTNDVVMIDRLAGVRNPALAPVIERLTREHYAPGGPPKWKSEEALLETDARKLCDHLRALRLAPADRDRVVSENAADLAEAFGTPGVAAELDAKRAIEQGTRVAAAL